MEKFTAQCHHAAHMEVLLRITDSKRSNTSFLFISRHESDELSQKDCEWYQCIRQAKSTKTMALDSVGTGAVGYRTCRIRYLLVPAFLVALISICHLTYTCDRQRRDSNEVVLIFCPPGGPKISTQKGDTRLSGIPFLSRLFGPTEQSRNQDLDMAFFSGSRERFRRSNFRLGLACTV